jgi:Asp-tRNA(Asn)/Glu-tRNA(Gln) amidotransferase A subunit family amidase
VTRHDVVGRPFTGRQNATVGAGFTPRLDVAGCLDRIRALDPSIHAWVQVAPQPAEGEGALSGVPFGAKDIIETRGLATEYGSPIYKGRIGVEDAAIVRELRRRGAILLGKTQTTAFAYRTPAPTRNPRNLEHTPGGSSSGSAAAVACGMAALALGTQTLGSVLRPASFCGVAGFKPTHGVVSLEGVLPLAPSLDTLGFFTPTAADMLTFWQAFGQDAGHDEDVALGLPDPFPDVDASMAAAFGDAVSRFRAGGLVVRVVQIGDMLTRLNDAARVVMAYEAARVHEQRYREHGSQLSDLATLIREGIAVSEDSYETARRYLDECRTRVADFYKTTPIILVPAAVGPAPFSLASTGDPRMNAPWTALGTPAATIPMGDVDGLPLGLQVTANRGEDGRVLRTAVRLETLLAST